MEILSKLTPSETYMITNYTSVKFKDLMRLTFLDLLLKRVIEMKAIPGRLLGTDNSPISHNYIVAGNNFRMFKAKKHEQIFLSPFYKNESIEILFTHFIQMAYQTAERGWTYKRLTRSNNDISSYFKNGFFAELFHMIRLTDGGMKLRQDISYYIGRIDSRINKILIEDPEEAVEVLRSLGGNIFLLRNLDFKLVKEIDKELRKRKRNLESESNDSDSDWWYYTDFFEDESMFDAFFDNYDGISDAFESEFDSSSYSGFGDGGDSGCDSGCGGCGD